MKKKRYSIGEHPDTNTERSRYNLHSGSVTTDLHDYGDNGDLMNNTGELSFLESPEHTPGDREVVSM